MDENILVIFLFQKCIEKGSKAKYIPAQLKLKLGLSLAKSSKAKYIFVCLYLFIIGNKSNIAKFKIKNKMEENTLVNFFVSEMYQKKSSSKSQQIFVCLYLFIISNNSNIAN